MKKVVSLFLALISFSVIIPTGTVIAEESNASKDDYYQEAYNLALIIENNTYFNEETKILTFDVENAIYEGLDKETAEQIEDTYNNMTAEEAEETYQAIIMSNYSSRSITGVLAAAAKILGKAGLTWLAQRLYDWGSEKFCDNYKDYNSITDNVCGFLGY